MTPVKEIVGAMSSCPPEDAALIERAYEYSKNAHKDHKRYSGEPYFVHPAAVGKILAELGMDAQTIAAGLLHDAIEDALATPEDVREKFGPEILFLVEGVTKLGKHKYHGAERHAESLRRLLVATSEDVRVLIVKLADRYHNMQTISHVPEHKRKRIALETLEIFAPLADRLGMGHMKKELEDLSFPVIDPDAYQHAVEVRKLKTKETEAGLKRVQKELQKELAKRDIHTFKTDIRMKGLWSLHQKLKRKGDDIDQIHDIAALRIIVKTIDECYVALGVIHARYKPLPGRFKDYIAFPKPNGYRSLHTTVLTSDAGIVEMQVRTEEMHQRAQYGIASHMSYKHLGKNAGKGAFEALSFAWVRNLVPGLLNFSKKKPVATATTKPVTPAPHWLTELADVHKSLSGSEEFMGGLREDFFSHRIFLFTPKGDVIDLPIESTPLDFAYAIHSDLGDHVAGAKVNSKMVSLDTTLRNGDIVEIIRKDSAHPSQKWLDMAKTSLARRNIRTALEAAGSSIPTTLSASKSAKKPVKARKKKEKSVKP